MCLSCTRLNPFSRSAHIKHILAGLLPHGKYGGLKTVHFICNNFSAEFHGSTDFYCKHFHTNVEYVRKLLIEIGVPEHMILLNKNA